MESNQVLAYEDPSKTFLGVRFVLLGFDSVNNKEKIESKLLDAGGVDAVNYGSECTHVIVDKLVYDDPVCVAARRDGKTLVSGLWVDHSFDVGMPVDPTSVMYRPMRDLNGIPGAKSLIICLTGYQRQDRDDIMTMVSLMGANFSKPLVANKVTHLICYKFEGEKYELAKKMKKIKLINHRWLEDCLKAWEILPESDYAKSGYELEMETEAKDSEEETEDMAAVVDVRRKYVMSPQITATANKSSLQSPLTRNSTYASASKTSAAIGETSNFELRSRKEADLEKASFSGDKTYGHVEMPSASSALNHGKISSELPSSMFAFMMDSGKNKDILAPASESAKKFPAADVCKLHSETVLRSPPTKPTLSLSSGRTERNSGSPSSKNIDEVLAGGGSKMSLGTHQDETDGFKTPPRRTDLQLEEGKTTSSPGRRKSPLSRNSSKSTIVRSDLKILETYPDGTDGVKTPVKRTDLQVEEEKSTPSPDRRKTTLSHVTSKSTRLRNDLKTSVESESAIKLKEALTSEISTDGSRVLSRHTSNITHCNDLGEEAPLSPKEALKVPVTLKDRRESNDEALKCYSRGLEKQTSSTNLDVKDLCLNLTDNSAGEAMMHQREMKSIETPVPGADTPMVEKSNEQVDLNFSEVEHAIPKSSTLKRKMPAKKTLGARRSIAKGATTKLKGSLQKSVLQNEDFYHSNVVVATGGTDSASISEKVDAVFPSNSSKSPMANIQDREATTEDNPVGDKTKAQDEKVESEFDTANKKEKFAEVEVPQPRDMCQEKTVGVSGTGKQADGEIVLSNSKVAKSLEDKKDGETSEAVSSKKVELAESKPTPENIEKKLTKGKKRPLAKSKAKKVKDSMEEGKTGGSSDKQEKKKTVAGDEKTVALAGKSKKRPSKKLKSSPDAEKENDPVTTEHQSTSNVTGAAGKEVSQLPKKSPRKGLKSGMCGDGLVNKGQDEKVTAEPTWFILSGHRLQRKEFQQLIKRLKGRVCRDSHNWSYQATHLIVPDPIRRTEKFFAAVASGSWVLTTDYLSASNEAGKLLSEEPYEWNKKCLSEDGAINLEAPRKWRLLRKRTGHGAFYGMRIIIYGECIAPPLDTLKRVIKAGEGTILATAPPYNRFFQSRVDFAIVSPGMPRVDMWVQEFLRHEIPCILSDYLVEYVCKPGYSLERHVQYNTHAWAEKSLKNLVRRVEEVADEVRTPEAEDDLACQVCESRDRGDEMLICGDESGDLGCGVGIHVDCLDPPLTDIPEDDWFCPSCSAKRGRKNVRQSSSKQSKSKK